MPLVVRAALLEVVLGLWMVPTAQQALILYLADALEVPVMPLEEASLEALAETWCPALVEAEVKETLPQALEDALWDPSALGILRLALEEV